VLEREVAARNASDAALRIRAAAFPARKTLDAFVFDHQPGVRRDDVAPLAAGPLPDRGAQHGAARPTRHPQNPHLTTALGIAACHAGHRVLFATAGAYQGRCVRCRSVELAAGGTPTGTRRD
jgi:hypothetical protein